MKIFCFEFWFVHRRSTSSTAVPRTRKCGSSTNSEGAEESLRDRGDVQGIRRERSNPRIGRKRLVRAAPGGKGVYVLNSQKNLGGQLLDVAKSRWQIGDSG